MEQLLITGVAKGIGRYLHERLGGIGLTRENAAAILERRIVSDGARVIIHCAFNSAKSVAEPQLCDYYADNVLLTHRLLSIPHRRFIFFSTVDVYTNDGSIKREEDTIRAAEGLTPYSFTKLLSEALIKKAGRAWLILRPAQMLGDATRRNVLARIMNADPAPLPLSASSVVNCILYSDVLAFLDVALRGDLTGTFNLAASRNATLGEIAVEFGKVVTWGEHFYDIGTISNAKAAALVPGLRRSTLDAIRVWYGAGCDATGSE
jgi:nucleoside-diphosphate-sugar epimerase